MRALALALASLSLAACGGRAPANAEPTAPPVATAPAPPDAAEAPNNDACDPVPNKWEDCVGKDVRITGNATPPQEVMSHPSLRGGPFEPEGQWEGYFSADGRQIPFLTTDPQCPGAMILRGTLSKVDLGGEPGTRGSYSGYAVPNAKIECK